MGIFELCFIGAAYLMGLATALGAFGAMLGRADDDGGCIFRWLSGLFMGLALVLAIWGVSQ